jgi:hypothetical protein
MIAAVGGYIEFKVELTNTEATKQDMTIVQLSIPGGV